MERKNLENLLENYRKVKEMVSDVMFDCEATESQRRKSCDILAEFEMLIATETGVEDENS